MKHYTPMDKKLMSNRFMHRFAIIAMLLTAFALGARAQVQYIMYYDTETTPPVRHYLSMNSSGTGVEDVTEFSTRCVWEADGALYTVKGAKEVKQKSGTANNIYNEPMRRALRSVAFPTKYLIQNSGENEGNVVDGPWNFNIGTSASAIRWMMDNEYSSTPILYYYYYKHYIYSDGGNWKYSTSGYEKPTTVKIDLYSLLPPVINMIEKGSGVYEVSITATQGCEIYYTTDGSDPSSSAYRTLYTGLFDAIAGATVKAIAINGNDHVAATSQIELPESLVVTLDDRENHTWTYYNGVNVGNYKTQYAGKLYSPDPRDVKITYLGGGITLASDETGNANAAVGIDAPETAIVYHKTLEKVGANYPYTTITNPFSKRPSRKAGSSPKQYYGFAGWRVKSISGGSITSYPQGSTIPAEEEVSFAFTGEYTPNTTSAEVVLEAVWVPAQTTYFTSAMTKDTKSIFEFAVTNTLTPGVATTHENNFLVLDNNYTGTITVNSPCNIMMVEPDGSADYRGLYMLSGAIVPLSDANNRTKIEHTNWKIGSVNARGRNFTIGRGMELSATNLYGSASQEPVNQILRIESGTIENFVHYADYTYDAGAITKQWVTLGCDYDRAKGDNDKLVITKAMYVGHYCTLNLTATDEMCRVYGLSGKFLTNLSVGTASYTRSYYVSVSDGFNLGHRYLEIQGGEWLNIAGGTNNYRPSDSYTDYSGGLDELPAFTLRMKGGRVKGSIYGGAEYYNAVGSRTYIITGGTIQGWVAGGANGTRGYGGQMYGASYMYIGGNTIIDSNPSSSTGSTSIINHAVGGNVFGAGCGYNAESSSGQVTLGTNVVIADNAYVERGVYGGGSYGFCPNGKASNIFITGGTVGGSAGGVSTSEYDDKPEYDDNIQGGVYGGACQNNGGIVNIYMTGGNVNVGIYGGSNASGIISGNVSMNIHDGTVAGNVYGGGYGSSTQVSGTVDLTLGQSTGGTSATINGDVYGGGAEGQVNNNIAVVANATTLNGNLYGGGHGTNAEVQGNTSVTMNGGTIRNVFGGGNAAAVTGNTNVTITGGQVKQNVYGGGNQASVSGTTNVVIGKE